MITSPIATLQAFTIAFTDSDFFGKMIILSLIFLSVVCWIVLCFKVWQAKKVKQLSFAFQSALEKSNDHLLNLDLDSLPKTTHSKVPNPYANIYEALKAKTLETLNKKLFFLEQTNKEGKKEHLIYLSTADLELLESHVYTTISYQSKLLEKDLFILSTIVTLAPFLGLLGTVWGILVTFSELQGGGSMGGSNSAILGGLSTALSTTVLGLVIAIPALISYNYLKNSLKTFSSDMEDFLHNLLSTIELQYRKVDIS